MKFFIIITMTFCITSCTNLFTHNIGKCFTQGDQTLAENNSTVLDRYSAWEAKAPS